jgi:hypothetical protein
MRKVILIAAILSSSFGISQTANQLWYFGNRCGLDFSSGSPVAITNSMMKADEGCVTISNNANQVLFYSNGDTVWNANHVPMPNGTGLFGQLSTSQSCLAVRKPGNPALYYLFTLACQGNANGLCYSEIDMTLNSGLGDVTANKNVPLLTPCLEKLAAVRHANGLDIWVVVHGLNSDAYYAYLVTSTGISAPVISNIGGIINSSFNNVETIGCMKISCDGRKMAVAHYGFDEIHLFDFSRTTGAVSNMELLNTTYSPYGIEFSATSNYLYVTSWSWSGAPIYQYDITVPNSAPTELQIGVCSGGSGAPASLQLGPDGKIYCAILFNDSLAAINNPDVGGLACNFVNSAVGLGGPISYYGLPNFIASGYCIPGNPDGVEESLLNDFVSVYPNPANNQITIDCSVIQEKYSVSITNSLGQLVYSENCKRAEISTIDLSGLHRGIYTLKIEADDRSYYEKLIVE